MPRPPATAVLFDLDNTLYHPSSGLFGHIDRRIAAFLRERFGLSEEEARERRRRYRSRYGITLVGLMTEEATDPADFLGYVHDVPVEEVLDPDPALDRLLGLLPCPLHVFTNGSTAHAERVLARLGVRPRIDRVFGIESSGYRPKPEEEAFLAVLGSLRLEPREVVTVDDLPENLDAARRLGMMTVLMGQAAGEHRAATSLSELESILLELTGP